MSKESKNKLAYSDKLQEIYQKAMNIYSKKSKLPNFNEETTQELDEIVFRADNAKGVFAVLTTLLVHKSLMPQQDIRYYQTKFDNGFSGRTIDTKFITPFLKSISFPAPSTSGWLTRTLESSQPYMLDYKPAISPKTLKSAFLNLIDKVQNYDLNSQEALVYIFALLVEKREEERLDNLANPHNLPISDIILLLETHFNYSYEGGGSGASRLPVLAIYSAYQCMMNQVKRYEDKILCELENHTSADTRSGSVGDVEIDEQDGSAFEGVEIKHNIEVTREIIEIAYDKFKSQQTKRYYILTTANMDRADWNVLNKEIRRISKIHGCQLIVNGVYSTLKYYLRLLDDTSEFIENYVENIKNDSAVKYQHRKAWNDIVSRLSNE
ncbi:hypothetical protein ACFO26_04825 [Lactococcus nasutitermitis]|uniref:DNA methyltransferase n=1 Tax=Lactococcus nasutitermitis TaxID=1652957 RepID=A0ABV9JFQ8_9LACT|nr:hypothetical protein [Lactococcus nasutitermitis]